MNKFNWLQILFITFLAYGCSDIENSESSSDALEEKEILPASESNKFTSEISSTALLDLLSIPTTIQVSEQGGDNTQTINIKITSIQPINKDLSLHYETVSLTADNAADYIDTSGEIQFSADKLIQSETISITIIDDNVAEKTEQFDLIIYADDESMSINKATISISIVDNDVSSPADLVGEKQGKNNILTWKTINSADSYRIYSKSSGLSGKDRFSLLMEISDNSYTHTDLDGKATYSYYVTALVGDQESSPGNIIELSPPPYLEQIFDHFERADQLTGGTTPSGHIWKATGPGHLTYGINNNRLTTVSGVYPYIEINYRDIEISADFIFRENAKSGSSIVLIADGGPVGSLLRNMVHLQLSEDSWGLIYRHSRSEQLVSQEGQYIFTTEFSTNRSFNIFVNNRKIQPDLDYIATRSIGNANYIITLVQPLKYNDVLTLVEEGDFINLDGGSYTLPKTTIPLHAELDIIDNTVSILLPDGDKKTYINDSFPHMTGNAVIWQLTSSDVEIESIKADKLSEPPTKSIIVTNNGAIIPAKVSKAYEVISDDYASALSYQIPRAIIPFGSDYPGIVLQSSLTSADEITSLGGEPETGSGNIFDPVKGIIPYTPNGTIPGVRFLSTEISDLSELPQGQLSIQIERKWLASTSVPQRSTGAEHNHAEHLFSYSDGGTTQGSFYAETSQGFKWMINSNGSVSYRFMGLANTTESTPYATITLSWTSDNITTLYIDGLEMGPLAIDVDIRNVFSNIYIGNAFGTQDRPYRNNYYIRNLVLSSTPVKFTNTFSTQRILQLGDSFSVGVPYSNIAPKYDGIISNTIIRNLAQVGIEADNYSLYSSPGGQIQDNGTKPLEQNTGTGLSRQATLKKENPTMIIFITGGNDSGIFERQRFTEDLHDHIEAFFGVGTHPETNVEHVILTTTVSNLFPGAPTTIEMVNIINQLPQWWDVSYPFLKGRLHIIDMWAKAGGLNISPTLFSQTDPVHPATTGNILYGTHIAREIMSVVEKEI